MAVLKGTKNFYDYEISDQVALNLKSWLDYGLLEQGAYTNIGLSSPYSTLQHTSSGNYEGLDQWIWESGVSQINGQSAPSQVSGIYVNGQFFPNGSTLPGGISWYTDYQNGRIITSKDLPSNSGVQCEYSVRHVATYLADSPQWKTIVHDFVENYSTLGSLAPSGFAQQIKEHRVWLPCVVVEVKDIEYVGFQIGGGDMANTTIWFHVFSDKPFSNKRLGDLIMNQSHKTLGLFDINKIPQALNYNGSLTGSGISYKDLINREGPYFWTYGYIDEITGSALLTEPFLSRGEYRGTIQVQRTMSTY